MTPIRVTPDGLFHITDEPGERDATRTSPFELIDYLCDISVPAPLRDLLRQLSIYCCEVNRWSLTVGEPGQPTPPPRPPAIIYAVYTASNTTRGGESRGADDPPTAHLPSQTTTGPTSAMRAAARKALEVFPENQLLGLAELASLTKIPVSTFQKAIDRTRLTSHRKGNSWKHLVLVRDAKEFVDRYDFRTRHS